MTIYIPNIDNDILNFATEVVNSHNVLLEALSDGLSSLADTELEGYELKEKSQFIEDSEKKYGDLTNELIKMCNGDEPVSGFYKLIAENIIKEEYEAADLNKDSLLWYFNDQYKKLNNIS